MAGARNESTAAGREPRPAEVGAAELGTVAGLDLHAQYFRERTGGDFFDAVRVGSRVAFLLSDIAGRRAEAGPIAAEMQEAFRASAAEQFGAADANLTEAMEQLVQAVNLALIKAAKGMRFTPTMLGCYDVQLGVLAYINAGGQVAVLHDSEGARPLPTVSMPLGLFTHLTFEASMQAFEPGARLLVVTKGVTESKQGKVSFGGDRVLDVLRSSKDESASKVCQEVLETAHKFERRRFMQRFSRKKKAEQAREDMTALAMVRSF
jgi:serine phosphatase RsbU (regulator of sigma subunit)